MLGRHKRQRTNSRSECQKSNCDLLYFSYLLLFFVSCLCVCVCSLFLLLPSVCVLFISDKSTSRASGKCKLRTFPPSFLSLSLCVSVSLSPVSLYWLSAWPFANEVDVAELELKKKRKIIRNAFANLQSQFISPNPSCLLFQLHWIILGSLVTSSDMELMRRHASKLAVVGD